MTKRATGAHGDFDGNAQPHKRAGRPAPLRATRNDMHFAKNGGLARLRERPMTHFVALTVGGLMVVGFGAIWASARAGHSEALNEARSIAEASLRTIILPNLTMDVLSGDSDALDSFDEQVRDHLLDDSVVRIKLWDQEGTVVYSDATPLIGERHEIEDHRLDAIQLGAAIADQGDLGDPENRFEQDLGPLLEVYLPFEGPDSDTMLFEVYFTNASVEQAAARIRGSVLPIVLSSLASVGLMTLLLASRLQHRLDRSFQERELLLRRSVDASAIERRRIAADLHDGVVQELSGTLMLILAAEKGANENSESATRIRQATAGVRQSLRSLRAAALEIHPPNLDDVSLKTALNDLVETFTGRHDFEVILSIQVEDNRHHRLLYRFVQEGLRNAAKHALPTVIEVSVENQGSCVVASVVDDGRNRPASDESGGMGIALLSELAAEVDGSVSFGPNRTGGSTLILEVPR